MVLLARLRKFQLCNQLSCIKNTTQSILFLTKLQNKNVLFRNLSTDDSSNEIQSKDESDSINQPPKRPDIGVCCESGCQNCVWLQYIIEVKYYYEGDKRKLQEALNCIPDPDIRAFVEMEVKK